MALGLKEGMVECATVCVKSEVILTVQVYDIMYQIRDDHAQQIQELRENQTKKIQELRKNQTKQIQELRDNHSNQIQELRDNDLQKNEEIKFLKMQIEELRKMTAPATCSGMAIRVVEFPNGVR